MRGCKQVGPLLSELRDGSLDEARARAVRGHLLECEACRTEAEAIDDIAAAASSLGTLDPPASVWQGIAARLDQEEIAYSRRPRLWWWWQEWRRTLLAGSGVLAAAAVVLALWVRDRHVPVAAAPEKPAILDSSAVINAAIDEIKLAEDGYTKAIDELRAVVGEEKAKWPAEMQVAFERNLVDIDAAVERLRTAARHAPDNPAAQEALYAAYRRKIDYLQEAVVGGGLR
jgi:hypothetical protein